MKTPKAIHTLLKLLLLVIALYSLLPGYDLYQYEREHPTKEYSWNRYDGPPAEYVEKVRMVNKMKVPIMGGLGVLALKLLLEIIDDPKDNWATPIQKFFKGLNDEEEH